jgi:hypothetical protein
LPLAAASEIAGWFLTRELSSNQKIEDCAFCGTNCAPIEAPTTY